MNGGRTADGVQDAVDPLKGPVGLLGVAGQVGLVYLDDIGVDLSYLGRQGLGQGEGQIRQRVVMVIQQRFGKHVRPRQGELERMSRQAARFGEIPGQIQ